MCNYMLLVSIDWVAKVNMASITIYLPEADQ